MTAKIPKLSPITFDAGHGPTTWYLSSWGMIRADLPKRKGETRAWKAALAYAAIGGAVSQYQADGMIGRYLREVANAERRDGSPLDKWAAAYGPALEAAHAAGDLTVRVCAAPNNGLTLAVIRDTRGEVCAVLAAVRPDVAPPFVTWRGLLVA